MHAREKVPRPTVRRLSLYLREASRLADAGIHTINSRDLGQTLGLTDAQIRKDLAYLGQLGHPGVGYQVEELQVRLRAVLGTDRVWNAVVVGAGNIGRALMNYGRFDTAGFHMVAVFDAQPDIIGTDLAGHTVRPMHELADVVASGDVQIGVVAVPAEHAQAAADALIAAGIQGILNFAPLRLERKRHVSIVSVSLTEALEQLAFRVSLQRGDVRDLVDPTITEQDEAPDLAESENE